MSVLEKIKETFEKPDKFSPENVQLFTQEILRILQELRPGFSSQNMEERTAALNSAREVQTYLQEQMKELCQSAGIEPDKMMQHFMNPDKAASLEKTKAEVEDLKAAMGSAQIQRLEQMKIKKPKRVKEWIAS